MYGTVPVHTCVHLDMSTCVWVNVHHCNWTAVEQKCDEVLKIRTDIIELYKVLVNALALTTRNTVYCLKLLSGCSPVLQQIKYF
jgi:hypothetical protein